MKYLFLILPVFALAACDLMKPPTYAESIWFNTLERWEVASAYERHCVKPKDLNVNLMGNVQIIVASLAGELGKRVESWSDKSKMAFVDKMVTQQIDPVRADLNTLFTEKGCESKEAGGAKLLYDLFSQNHPSKIHAAILKEIEKGEPR